jgi:DNA-binding GntR family transcriptional regulator
MLPSKLEVSDKLEALSHHLGRRPAIADQIAETIRGLIVSGDLKPGDRIVESRVAKQIGVGQPTVREALVALEHQGLVVRKANQGCVVTTMTRAEISQVLRIRDELERLAVDLAIEIAPDTEIKKLIDLARLMKDAAQVRGLRQYHDLDVQFHETLWRLSGNSILPRLLSQTLMPLLAFLFMRNLRKNDQLEMTGSAEAHLEIAEAILLRDKEAARQIVRDKFRMFADQHLNCYESEG